MGLRKVICGFIVCGNEFMVPQSSFTKFCSVECSACSRIIHWAETLVVLRKKGKSIGYIGGQLGMSYDLTRAKIQLLPRFRENYPLLDRHLTTIESNCEEGPHALNKRLTPAQIREIRTNEKGLTQRALAVNYNVSQGTISSVVLHYTYKGIDNE